MDEFVSNRGMEKEIWKPVIGFEGLYEVSNLGNVRNSKGILNTYNVERGYRGVNLSKKGKNKMYLVRRLVARSFCKNPNNKRLIQNKDGDITNDRASNLKWIEYNERPQNKKLTDKEIEFIKANFVPNSHKLNQWLYDKFKDKISKRVLSATARGIKKRKYSKPLFDLI